MERKTALAEAKKLAAVIRALNATPDGSDDDPLTPQLAQEWVRQRAETLRFQLPPGRRRCQAPSATMIRSANAKMDDRRRKASRRGLMLDEFTGEELTRSFVPLKHGEARGFQRSAYLLREWIYAWINSSASAKRSLEAELQDRTDLTPTDRIACHHFSRIVALGIYRCQYAKCAKLVLNTSGRTDRKYCTGTRCAGNATGARIMAKRFAALQAERIHRAKAAVASWPRSCGLKEWIASHANVSKRWITEAVRRGDLRLPSSV